MFRKANERRNRAPEYSLPTLDTHSHRQQCTASYFPHLKTCITTSHLCSIPILIVTTRTRACCQKSWTHKLSTLWRSLPMIIYLLKIKLSASPASPALPCYSSLSGAQRPRGQQPVGDKQALLANEKRRRRGESYIAVERRRRDNISMRRLMNLRH